MKDEQRWNPGQASIRCSQAARYSYYAGTPPELQPTNLPGQMFSVSVPIGYPPPSSPNCAYICGQQRIALPGPTMATTRVRGGSPWVRCPSTTGSSWWRF